ncbi:sensor domain-containing diguanylate cyclase [Chiayiivirga flava]|uniref:diguanylate cyclase n=1 Tax=Chiayiivirga flava TaxID=659595 RepID=A0A7W8G1T4_9GAMM|nr:sensor domain-containing diguanylate cyclase [Chiayiivirga flava]MBB5209213.1 diguanylate cyclase [Chiayiivirga flava]
MSSPAPDAAPDGPARVDAPRRALPWQGLPRTVYLFRVLGMGLGLLPVSFVLRDLHAGWMPWAWSLFACLLWPHLAFALARASRDPFRAERRNLYLDSIFAASLVPLMQFNLLPSVLLLVVATADKISTGIRGLWLRTLPAMAVALLVAGACTGFAWQPHTSMAVMLASLPILVIHTLAVALNGYRLIRKVQKQNQRLDDLNRIDALTGLQSRAHWQQQAEAALHRSQQRTGASTLLLVDVDRFKDINDHHGHAVGDDVLRAIADVVRRVAPAGSDAGRLGGDEYVVVLPTSLSLAESTAEAIRAGVEGLRFPRLPSLRCSVSLGLAEPPAAGLTLREWLEAADRALYRAKAAGRNCTASRDAVRTPQR